MNSSKTVTINIKPGIWDIFAYKMYHTFICVAGVGRILFSAIFLAFGIGTAGNTETYLTVIVIAIGLLNVIVTPIIYLVQSAKASKANTYVTYVFSRDNIKADDGNNHVELSWNSLALVVWLRKELLLYTSPYEALILPRRQMNGQDEVLWNIIKASAMPNRTVKRKLL